MKTIYLYVKTHDETGLKYFGKTVCKDPFSYLGSGTYWKNHLAKHGANISTEIVKTFTDLDEAKAFALNFSIDNDIVKSTKWANLKLECIDGGWDHITSEHIQKGIAKIKAKPIEEQNKINAKKSNKGAKNGMFGRNRSGENNPRFGVKLSEEQKINQSKKMKNRVNGIDKDGTIHNVLVGDDRFNTGELKTLNKGTLVVRNKNGDVFSTSVNDPLYQNGELVSVNTGKIRTSQEKQHLSNIVRQLKWFNNGSISIRRVVSPDETWVPGRLMKNKLR